MSAITQKYQAAWFGVLVLMLSHFAATIWFAAEAAKDIQRNSERYSAVNTELQRRADSVYNTPVRVQGLEKRLDKIENTLQLIWQEVKK